MIEYERKALQGVPDYRAAELLPKRSEYCLLIPVINEGARILTELGRAQTAGVDTLCDIVICDGGSTDGSMKLDTLQLYGVNTLLTKTGFMVGLGETEEQISRLMDDILETGCDILTIGQYLQPSPQHYPLARYATPEDFARWKELALSKGFRHVASAPLARSSYKAWEALEDVHDLY